MTTSIKKNKVIIFGADSDLAKPIINLFKKNHDLIGFSKRRSNKKILNLKCNFKDKKNIFTKTKNIISKNNSIRTIIISIGRFNKSLENYDRDLSEDFLVTKNILEIVTKKIVKENLEINIIIITSMDAFVPNTNSFKYSIGKSSISTLIKLYKKKYKKYKLNFFELAPGPINTRMRLGKKENKNNLLQPIDIAKICFALSEINKNVDIDTIKIYPKKWNFNIK
tara:strand:- start:432 stop:1103 length:672 start_codon:yes stop_codon:yes gene_type:complete